MRPWMIVVGSATGALSADVAWNWPKFLTAPYPWHAVSAITAFEMIVVGLAVYTGLTIGLVTASTGLDLCRARRRITRLRTPTRSAWFAALSSTGLMTLTGRLLDLAPGDGDELLLQSPFNARAIRAEFLNYYRDWLTRTHAFTGFTLLLLIAILGLAQRHDNIIVAGIIVPAAEILTVIAVLVILGIFSLLVVEAIAESLLRVITRLPLRRLDILLLLRTGVSEVEKGEVHSAQPWPQAQLDALRRLDSTLEETSNLLREVANNLWATTQAVAEAARATTDRAADTTAIEKLSLTIQQLSANLAQGSMGLQPTLPTSGSTSQNQFTKQVRELLAGFG